MACLGFSHFDWDRDRDLEIAVGMWPCEASARAATAVSAGERQKFPLFPSVSAQGTEGTAGKGVDLRENGGSGTVKNGYFVPVLSHFGPIFLNHIPPQPSTPHVLWCSACYFPAPPPISLPIPPIFLHFPPISMPPPPCSPIFPPSSPPHLPPFPPLSPHYSRLPNPGFGKSVRSVAVQTDVCHTNASPL